MRLTLRAAALALASCSSSAVAWSLLGATVGQLLRPNGTPLSVREFLVAVPWTFVGALYFASFIAALAFLPYTVLFAVWLRAVTRNPRLVATRIRRAGAGALMAVPPAVLLAHGFASSPPESFDWTLATRVFSLALVSGSLGSVLAFELLRLVDAPLRK